MAPQYFTSFQCPQTLEFTVFPMYEVPPNPGISGICGIRSIVIVWVQNLCNGCYFCPKSFVHATVSLHMLRAFSGGLSVLEFRTQSRNEQAQMEPTWELPVDFWFCVTVRVRIFLKDGALSSLSKNRCQIYATQKILKSRSILKHFPNGFSGRSTPVCVAAFGCQYFYADQPKL